ncbi:4Fe-4S binding protein [Clostridium grantii]|nr:4Fe-4S binding protein [Clostridium grantii]
MGLSLNKVVKPQMNKLNKKAILFANKNSPTKRLYVEGEKPNLNKSDFLYLIKNLKKVYQIPHTLYRTMKLIEKDKPSSNSHMSKEKFDKLKKLLSTLGVDNYGYFEITPDKVFKNCGVPHKYALVISSSMDKAAFKTAPSIECQLEVAKVYHQTGDAANKVAEFLQKEGFGASPNHSMGGQLDYSMGAQWAGFAIVGRHSMAITKNNGACHRISIVYTDIVNLDKFITSDTHDMEWIREFCKKCGKCIRKCPSGAILQESITLDGVNPTCIDYKKCCEGFLHYGCGICIKECPFTSGDYEKIKSAYLKKSRNK